MFSRAALRGVLIFMVLVLVAGFAAGCTGPEPSPGTKQGNQDLTGHVVTWTTGDPTLGAVAYRAPESDIWRVAYPEASLRADKAFVTEHSVPLMTAEEGSTVIIRLLDRTETGRLTASDEFEFVVGERPAVGRLLQWTMIDVGFGDSHLLTMPGTGRRILIDAGERRDWSNVDRFLRGRGITRLDVVVGTHIHIDHMGGLVGSSGVANDGVLGAYDVGVFLDSEFKSVDRSVYPEILDLLSARDIDRFIVRTGDTDDTNSQLVWDPAVGVQVFNAGADTSNVRGSSEGDVINNESIVFRLTFGDVNFILGGDAEGPTEAYLDSLHGGNLNGEVLKVHHHGHNDSSVSGYLTSIDPRVALIPITTFESSQGSLPSSAVLGRLRNSGADIYASDRAEPLGIMITGSDGLNITVSTDGTSYEVLVEPSASVHVQGGSFSPGEANGNPEDFIR